MISRILTFEAARRATYRRADTHSFARSSRRGRHTAREMLAAEYRFTAFDFRFQAAMITPCATTGQHKIIEHEKATAAQILELAALSADDSDDL